MKRVVIVLGFLCMTLSSFCQADWRYKLLYYGNNDDCCKYLCEDDRAYIRICTDFYATAANGQCNGVLNPGPYGESEYKCHCWTQNDCGHKHYEEEIIFDFFSACQVHQNSPSTIWSSTNNKKPTKIFTVARNKKKGEKKVYIPLDNGYVPPMASHTMSNGYYTQNGYPQPTRYYILRNKDDDGEMDIRFFQCEPIIGKTSTANYIDSLHPENEIVCSNDNAVVIVRPGFSSYTWQYFYGTYNSSIPNDKHWVTIPTQTKDTLNVNYSELTELHSMPNSGFGRSVWFRCLVDGQPMPSLGAETDDAVTFFKSAPKVVSNVSVNTSCYYSQDGKAVFNFDRFLNSSEVLVLTLFGRLDTTGNQTYVDYAVRNKVIYYNQMGSDKTIEWDGLGPGEYAIKMEGYYGDSSAMFCDTTRYSFNIGRPSKVDFTLAKNDLTCFQKNDGKITVSATGGNGGFTYSKNNGAYQTSNVFSNLPIGNYNIIVKDSKGCFINPPNEVIQKSISLSQPTKLNIKLDDIHDALGWGRSDGYVHVSGVGGTQPYTYSWSNGSTQAKNNGLASGTYTVTVKDKNNCSEDSSYFIDQPDPLVADVDTLDYILCHSDHNGSLIVKTIGGVPPYTYLWNTNDTDSIVRGLPTGKYSVTVTDINQNVTYATIYLGEPDTLDITEIITAASCEETPTGAIDITPSGGTAPYTFSWIYGETTEDISELMAGSYFVTMRDANECLYEKSFSVVSPNALNAEISGVSPVCYNGKNGYVELEVTGGTEPYRYAWSASNLDEPKIENLHAGVYTSTVTDAHNCSFINTFTLSNPEQIEINIPKDNYVLCLDQKLTLNGEDYSDPNVTYYWQSDKGFSDKNSVVEIEDAALYTITIANKEGCTNSDKFRVERSNEKIEASLFITSKGYNDESVVVVNGSLEYDSIFWSLPTGAVLVGSDDTYCEFDIKDNGLYNVGVTSLKGRCSAYAEKPISIVDRPYLLQQDSVNYTTLIHTLDVYPIPTSDIVNVRAELYEKADLNVRIYNLLSNLKVYENRHDNKSLHEFQIDLTPSPAGVYILLIETKRDKKVIRVMKQ